MRYILCDYQAVNNNKAFEAMTVDNTTIIDAAEPVARCIGCFKCWLKNPGNCAFSDKMEHIGAKLLNACEIIIICKSLYGGFSVNIKRIIDRVIPGVLPFFIKRNNELHHTQRYENSPKIKAIFYNGDEMSEAEREQAKKLLAAVALNFNAESQEVVFTSSFQEALSEVTA